MLFSVSTKSVGFILVYPIILCYSLMAREVSAVAEWRGSGAKYHAMRDHPSQAVPILGGLFGMRMGTNADHVQGKRDFISMARSSRGVWKKVLLRKVF